MQRKATLLAALVCLMLSVAARLVHFNQSLWCDEMGIPVQYAHAPWRQIVAAKAGEFTPGNHVLYIILAKLILSLANGRETDAISHLIRLPSLVAGSLLPLVLVWPLRKPAPVIALLLALLAIVQPWLITFSDEARGYALMTLLGVLATNLLPDGKTRWPLGYAVVVALMIYTVPVAGMLLLAHGITVNVWRPAARLAWVRGLLLGGGAALLLFLPLSGGIWYYMHHPQPGPDNFSDFINQLPRLAGAGDYLPYHADPASHNPDPVWGVVFWIVPVIVLIAGSICAVRIEPLCVPTTAMATATLLFYVAALFIPSAGQARFAPWCAIWLILACAAGAVEIQRRYGTPLTIASMAALLSWFIARDILLLPSEPIREAVVLADRMVPSDTQIIVGFLSSQETIALYGQSATHHHLTAAAGPLAFITTVENDRRSNTPAPWLIISFEVMVHDTTPQFWQYLRANYQLKARLPGRISPVAVYMPREDDAAGTVLLK